MGSGFLLSAVSCVPFLLLEVVDESGEAFESLLLRFFHDNTHADGSLDGSAQIEELLKVGRHIDVLTGKYGLGELQFVHTVIHLTLQITHFHNLVPHYGKQRQGEVTVGNGLSERTFGLAAFLVYVNPLMVERGIGKLVDALLSDMDALATTQFLTHIFCKVFVRIDFYHDTCYFEFVVLFRPQSYGIIIN